MRVQIAEGVLYPDVMMTCDKAETGDEQTVTGPKLIIEVLSPCIGGYDKRGQFSSSSIAPWSRCATTFCSIQRSVRSRPFRRHMVGHGRREIGLTLKQTMVSWR